jgi:ABC-type Zn uptake system ZnuABC Zn-binding protein ZnuA
VGLSAGFIEPLEASALALVEQSANILCEHFPRNAEVMNVVAKRFNEKLSYHWQSIIEFLKLHYVISQRDDSDYWREARSMQGCPQRLQEKIQLWQQQPPWHDDAPRIDELFPSASYQYVLYGMGFSPKYTESNRASYAQMKGRAEQLLSVNRDKIEQMSALLPTNRALITSMLSAAQ